ncbi:hypothetical protein ANO14919_036180 [Xylariales sp. No.14919]|nr:hypothetical protein ANO14919_036180 [Xylariales sp. No.14919]
MDAFGSVVAVVVAVAPVSVGSIAEGKAFGAGASVGSPSMRS